MSSDSHLPLVISAIDQKLPGNGFALRQFFLNVIQMCYRPLHVIGVAYYLPSSPRLWQASVWEPYWYPSIWLGVRPPGTPAVPQNDQTRQALRMFMAAVLGWLAVARPCYPGLAIPTATALAHSSRVQAALVRGSHDHGQLGLIVLVRAEEAVEVT